MALWTWYTSCLGRPFDPPVTKSMSDKSRASKSGADGPGRARLTIMVKSESEMCGSRRQFSSSSSTPSYRIDLDCESALAGLLGRICAVVDVAVERRPCPCRNASCCDAVRGLSAAEGLLFITFLLGDSTAARDSS